MNDLTVIAKPTRVSMLLDESSSMLAHETVTLSALDEYITELKQGGQSITLSLVTFSNLRTATLIKSQPIKAVDMDAIRAGYHPAGSTPLIDAAMKLILATEKAAQPGENIIIALQTDGEENCSNEYKLADLQTKIKEKSDAGWQFVFLGAGLDAYQQGALYGIHAGSTMSYGTDAQSTRSAFRSMAQNTTRYASGATGQSINSMDFSEQDRVDAGDQYVGQGPANVQGPAPTTTWTPQPTLPEAKAPQGTMSKPKSLVGDIEL